MVRSNSKEVILDAAEAVVLEAGAGHLSLDMVARKAGISKGGLMYNFPTKEALLKAMLDRLIAQFYDDKARIEKNIPRGPGQSLKAGIMAVMDENERRDHTALAILAAAAYDPSLLETLRQVNKEHVKELAGSDVKFERAAIISLASDGLLLWELLRISPFSKDERERLKEEMMRMIDESRKG